MKSDQYEAAKALQQEKPDPIKLLRELEWNGQGWVHCPTCDGCKNHDHPDDHEGCDDFIGHAPGCEHAAIIV